MKLQNNGDNSRRPNLIDNRAHSSLLHLLLLKSFMGRQMFLLTGSKLLLVGQTPHQSGKLFVLAPHEVLQKHIFIDRLNDRLKMNHSRPLFLYGRLFKFQLTVNVQYNFFADDWIQTADLWNWKRPLYQLSHNYFLFQRLNNS